MTQNFRVNLIAHAWWIVVGAGLCGIILAGIFHTYWWAVCGAFVLVMPGLIHYLEAVRYNLVRERVELDHVAVYNRAREQAQEEFEDEWFGEDLMEEDEDEDESGTEDNS